MRDADAPRKEGEPTLITCVSTGGVQVHEIPVQNLSFDWSMQVGGKNSHTVFPYHP